MSNAMEKFRIVFDIRKCAQLNISSEAISFWDRGNGNNIINSNFSEIHSLTVDTIIKLNISNCERDIYKDFNTYDFRVVEKKIKTPPNYNFYYQIKIQPIVLDQTP